MLRAYREHPEFDEFTVFDTQSGRRSAITASEFAAFLPSGRAQMPMDAGGVIQRSQSGDATVFTGETPETHTRFPRRVYFQITRNCNLHCDYCFIRSERGAPHVPTNAVMDMAEFMGRCGLMEVRLTGGEPTTHPQFGAIVREFQARDVYVSVATNGVMSQAVLDELADIPNLWVICSVDGTPQTHNRYRPGTFDTIMRNLRQLKSRNPGIRLRLTTVLTRENMGQMRELGLICRSIDAESITVIPLRPQVRSAWIRDQMVSAKEFLRVINDLVAAKRELGIRFTTTIETDYQADMYKDPVVRKRTTCAAGREATNLDYDAGKRTFLVYGCSYSPAPDLEASASIRKPFLAGEFDIQAPERFLDIWRDEEAWSIYRDMSLRPPECRDCTYFREHRCVGACPIQNIDYSRIDESGDVLDQLREQLTSTAEHYCYKRIFD